MFANWVLSNEPADFGITRVLSSKSLVGYINSICVDELVYVGNVFTPTSFKLFTTWMSVFFNLVIAAVFAPKATAA